MRHIRWLAILPAAGILGGVVPFNRVTPYVLGMPVLLAWMVFCVLLASAVLAIIYRLDPANREPAEGESGQ